MWCGLSLNQMPCSAFSSSAQSPSDHSTTLLTFFAPFWSWIFIYIYNCKEQRLHETPTEERKKQLDHPSFVASELCNVVRASFFGPSSLVPAMFNVMFRISSSTITQDINTSRLFHCRMLSQFKWRLQSRIIFRYVRLLLPSMSRFLCTKTGDCCPFAQRAKISSHRFATFFFFLTIFPRFPMSLYVILRFGPNSSLLSTMMFLVR